MRELKVLLENPNIQTKWIALQRKFWYFIIFFVELYIILFFPIFILGIISSNIYNLI
jgi:hypothetical protein